MEDREFQDKIIRVDNIARDYVENRGWQQYVPRTDNEQFRSFCHHLMYVISKFLEDTDKRELFIQLPIEELADLVDGTVQNSRWQDAATTIMSCLSLATANRFRVQTLGEICEGDHVLYVLNSTVRRCFIHNGQPITLDGKRDGQYNMGFYKTKCRRDVILNRQNRGKLYEFLLCFPQKVQQLCVSQLLTNYISAAMVSIQRSNGTDISPKSDLTLWNSNWVNTPVDFANGFRSVTGSNGNYDVLVVIGDRRYTNGEFTIEQRYRNTRARKIIYIGTKAIDGIDETYAFSIREMCHYCYNDEISLPIIVVLPFDWLRERQEELSNLLSKCAEEDSSLTQGVRNQVSRKFLSLFMNADFSLEKLEDIKQFWDEEKIGEIFEDPNTSEDTIHSVYEWFQNLRFDGLNPKRQYMDNHPVSRSFSRWQSIKGFVKSATGNNRSIILDNLGYNKYDERYSYILRYNLPMRVTSLYYEGFEDHSINSLNRFLENDFWYVSSPYRDELGTSLIAPTPTRQTLTLDDLSYLDFESKEENRSMYSSGNRTRYLIQFEDRTRDFIDGDVLLKDEEFYERITIAELFERGNYRGVEITYYKSPANLDEFIGLPVEQIESCSRRWKNAFITHFQSLNRCKSMRQVIDDIHNACPPLTRGMIYCYSKNNSHQFLQKEGKMKAMCNYLVRLNLITEDDAKYIIRARKAVQIRKSFGRQLKDDILKSFIDENYRSDLLRDIEELRGYTRQDLIGQMTETKIINNIKL